MSTQSQELAAWKTKEASKKQLVTHVRKDTQRDNQRGVR